MTKDELFKNAYTKSQPQDQKSFGQEPSDGDGFKKFSPLIERNVKADESKED